MGHARKPANMTRRAYEVQGLLSAGGQHRAPSVADLLLAATAEAVGLTVLHCDKDFELIAEVTGQALCRLQGKPPPNSDSATLAVFSPR